LDDVSAACERWFGEAYKEWGSLLGEAIPLERPRFVWKPAAGRLACPFAGACALSSFWRAVSRRLDECSYILDGRRPGGNWLLQRHFEKLSLASARSDITDEVRVEAVELCRAAGACTSAMDSTGLRKLAAIAAKKAHRIEQNVASRRSTAWKHALAAPRRSRRAGPPPRRAWPTVG